MRRDLFVTRRLEPQQPNEAYLRRLSANRSREGGLRLIVAAFGLAFASCSAPVARAQVGRARAETALHTFTLRAAPDVKSVNVAGTFNGWNASATPLTRQLDGSWSVALLLPYGRHEYKFVLDGQRWITDSAAQKNQDDGSGNVNSVLLLAPPDYKVPARAGDGVVALSALSHPREIPRLNYDQGQLTLSLRARAGDIQAASVRVNGRTLPMALASSDDFYAFYTARLPWNRKSDLRYLFAVRDGGTLKYLGASGVASSAAVARPFTLSARNFKPFVVPSWVEKSVIYQIFPDRFANGDKRNDPPDVVAWDAAPTWFNRFGGDAAGVNQHFKYLQGLGVSAVYFNPVFASPSNHRYDASDFKKIDPQFGTNAEFAALTRAMQKRGIRTVMDFVFNHTATNFAPFQDIRDKGEASAFKDWYFIKSFPVRVEDKPNYEAWYGYPSMPKLNVLNPPTRDYLLGLVNFWKQNAALSGLRLDVANEVKPEFWRLLRQRAKGIDAQTWIVGEQWGDAKPWLGGDQWDSVMNYQFRDAALKYFARSETKPSQFLARLMEIYNSYAPQVSRNAMNLLSSHDTPRFLTECKNDAALHRLAATLQFTWPGVPSIYYGEELGMEGGGDPGNRRGMEWHRANDSNPMLRFYKRMILGRKVSRALQSGSPQVLAVDDAANTFVFARVLDAGAKPDAAIVVINRSKLGRIVRVPLGSGILRKTSLAEGWWDIFSGSMRPTNTPWLQVDVPAMEAAVLVPNNLRGGRNIE